MIERIQLFKNACFFSSYTQGVLLLGMNEVSKHIEVHLNLKRFGFEPLLDGMELTLFAKC